VGWEAIGDQTLKNIAEPVRVYRMRLTASSASKPIENVAATEPSERPSLAVLPFANLSPEQPRWTPQNRP
jgi:adenylate cyclase